MRWNEKQGEKLRELENKEVEFSHARVRDKSKAMPKDWFRTTEENRKWWIIIFLINKFIVLN